MGAIQYIPANEQLEVFPEGTFFNLDTVSHVLPVLACCSVRHGEKLM